MNILFICLGNTCRSPMAEGLARHRGEETGVTINALSAGLFAHMDGPAMPEAIAAVADKVDISNHKTRQVEFAFVEAADYVVAMTADVKSILLRQFPFFQNKILTLAEWAGEDGDVIDPFGGNQEEYNTCANLIDAWLTKGWHRVTE